MFVTLDTSQAEMSPLKDEAWDITVWVEVVVVGGSEGVSVGVCSRAYASCVCVCECVRVCVSVCECV